MYSSQFRTGCRPATEASEATLRPDQKAATLLVLLSLPMT